MKRKLLMGAGILVLGGCAPEWTRPDIGDDVWVEQDERACQQQAALAMSAQSASFYGSLMDLYGQNFQPAGLRMPAMRTGSTGPMFDIDPVRRILEEDRLADLCMRARGYRLKEAR